MQIDILEGKSLKHALVGSRVTCNPAPTDTDQDVLVLTDVGLWATHLAPLLLTEGFEKGGSDCGDVTGYMAQTPLSFQSFTLGELNLIVTFDPEFYRRFMAATGVAKVLNLLDKHDRVMLFQAVLYGNDPLPDTPELLPMMATPAEYIGPYWVTFEHYASGCVEALNEAEARRIGEEIAGQPVADCDKIPYPAHPRLNKHIDPKFGACPSFCYAPEQCKGRGCCPQNYSCTE